MCFNEKAPRGSSVSFFATHVYKWVDDQGVTHFSERPPAGDHNVEHVEVPEANTSQSTPLSGAAGRKRQGGELLRMPESVRGEFLRTSAGWTGEQTKKYGPIALSQIVHIEVMPSVPIGALLEV